MPKVVVDLLEVIHIDHQAGDMVTHMKRAIDNLFSGLQKRSPGQDAAELVDFRTLLHAAVKTRVGQGQRQIVGHGHGYPHRFSREAGVES